MFIHTMSYFSFNFYFLKASLVLRRQIKLESRQSTAIAKCEIRIRDKASQ